MSSNPRWAALLAAAAVWCVASTSYAAFPDLSVRDQWRWYQDDQNFPMKCMDGSSTGYGYYVPSAWNGNVMFVFDGGGLCYDAQSCSNPSISPVTIAADIASNTKPGATQVPFVFRRSYSQANFTTDHTDGFNVDPNGAGWAKAPLNRGTMDHTSSINPFRNYMMVFVPYCTGDLHIGYRNDTSSGIAGRSASNVNFVGLLNSYYSFLTALQSVQNMGVSPAKIVLTGGSAGGFGATLFYGWARYLLGFFSGMHAQVITISDAGSPISSGTSSNGVTWTQQGYFGLPGKPASQVSSMEEYMYDAWGSTYMNVYPASLVSQPLGDGHSFAPVQGILAYNIGQSFNTSSKDYGDKFAIIDGTSDWLYWLMLPLYMNDDPQSRRPNVRDAMNQLATVVSLHVFFPVYNTAVSSGPLPWYKHHGFMSDDVSFWGSNGSNVSQMLSTLPL